MCCTGMQLVAEAVEMPKHSRARLVCLRPAEVQAVLGGSCMEVKSDRSERAV